MVNTNHEYMTILRDMKMLYFRHPNGLTDAEVAVLLRTTRAQIWRYRRMLHVSQVTRGRYTAVPSADEVEFASVIHWRTEYEKSMNSS